MAAERRSTCLCSTSQIVHDPYDADAQEQDKSTESANKLPSETASCQRSVAGVAIFEVSKESDSCGAPANRLEF